LLKQKTQVLGDISSRSGVSFPPKREIVGIWVFLLESPPRWATFVLGEVWSRPSENLHTVTVTRSLRRESQA